MTQQEKNDRLDMIARIARAQEEENAYLRELDSAQDEWKEDNYNSQEGML